MNDHLIVKILESRSQICDHAARDQLRILRVGRDGIEEITALDVFRNLLRDKTSLKYKTRRNLRTKQDKHLSHF